MTHEAEPTANPTARLATLGDVMLGRLVSRETSTRPPESFWAGTLPALRAADAIVLDLERAISGRGSAWVRTPKLFHFRAQPKAIEVLGRRPILHDTGDYLDDYAADPAMRNDWSFLFRVEIGAGGIHRLTMRPVVLGFAEVNFASGQAADAICARMVEQSGAFGTKLERRGDTLQPLIPVAA